MAIETLVTAISLIKQSTIAQDEKCLLYLTTLEDTKKGIEDKYYGASHSRRSPSSRDRDRYQLQTRNFSSMT
jgi:cleavage and polyadenylation specificity factor subunit 6/7